MPLVASHKFIVGFVVAFYFSLCFLAEQFTSPCVQKYKLFKVGFVSRDVIEINLSEEFLTLK